MWKVLLLTFVVDFKRQVNTFSLSFLTDYNIVEVSSSKIKVNVPEIVDS